MALLIIYAIISIFISFSCSVLEAVLLSITPTFITLKKEEHKHYAFTLEKLKADVDQPLIAILTLNTIAHTVGSILVGVQAEKTFGNGNNAVGIVSAIMTALILILSEIIPKTIGAKFWRNLANFTSKALVFLIFPLRYTGILWLLQLATKLIGSKAHEGSVLSREDFTAMTNLAQKEGIFEQTESNMIKSLLKFDQIQVKSIMTPRTVIKAASEEITANQFFHQNPKLRFSRIPVYQGTIDDISGFVLKDELLEEIIKGNGDKKLSLLKRDILITQRNVAIPQLFDTFLTHKNHIALVVDEYGSISGLVTMEDLIETILGLEIVDESDNVEDLQILARRSWQIRAKRLGIIDTEIQDNLNS
ncbi:CNNM domain-containing protein [Zhouia sp. PK063]|uniref:CNNM domain-containing protein n=1 Tax=Zhouia sp. PK063 TaxID=3373602 RepID=UPI0037BB9414